MAQPVDFIGSNILMKASPGTEESVRDVRAFHNDLFCVTYWKFSESELAEIARTGGAWLSVMGNGGMPPCFVGGEEETRDVIAQGGGPLPVQEHLS